MSYQVITVKSDKINGLAFDNPVQALIAYAKAASDSSNSEVVFRQSRFNCCTCYEPSLDYAVVLISSNHAYIEFRARSSLDKMKKLADSYRERYKKPISPTPASFPVCFTMITVIDLHTAAVALFEDFTKTEYDDE